MSDWNKNIIEEFRTNKGVVGGRFTGQRLLLLHSTGAKSGKEHLNPVAAFEDGERLFIIASKGGAPTNPDWYYNILANPIVEVEYGTDRFKAEAAVVEEPERSKLYAKAASKLSSFGDYEKKTDRVIPVITLSELK